MNGFQKHLLELKKKDEIALKKAERRMHSDQYDYNFCCVVYSTNKLFKKQISTIVYILKQYLDNPLGEFFFSIPFNEVQVEEALKDIDFTAMMIANNLMPRAISLNANSEGQVKLRIYIAILNYIRYKKEKAAAEKRRQRRGRK